MIEIAKESQADIILFTDGCTYQNRNVILSNVLWTLSIWSGVSITQIFVESGHIKMKVDSMHSTFERKIRNKKINVPADYVLICITACTKEPYIVEYFTHDF